MAFPAQCAASGRRNTTESIQRKRPLALRADKERIDVDGLDDIRKIAREPAEIDQRRNERVTVAGRAAAVAFEQAPGAGGGDQRGGPAMVEEWRRETDVVDQLDQDSAHAEHHDRAHLGIAREAEHGLDPVGQVLGDEKALAAHAERLAPRRQRVDTLAHGSTVAQVQQHQSGIALVRDLGGHGLEHDRKTDFAREAFRFVGSANVPFQHERNPIGAQQRLRFHFVERGRAIALSGSLTPRPRDLAVAEGREKFLGVDPVQGGTAERVDHAHRLFGFGEHRNPRKWRPQAAAVVGRSDRKRREHRNALAGFVRAP